MSGDVGTAVVVGLTGIAVMVGWYRVKFRPDRLRALAAAQQAYDLQARGHAADVAFYEQQLRRTRVVGVWAIAAGTLVGLAAVFLSGL